MAVCSNNDWDPLEEIIVGIAENALLPPLNKSTHSFVYAGEKWEDIQHLQGNHEQWVLDEGQEDLDRLADTLTGLGVKVHRPKVLDHTKEFSTPEWKTTGWYNFCPRDLLLPLDNMIIDCPSPMRSRYFETRAYNDYLYEQMKDGTQWICAPKPILEDSGFQLEHLKDATLLNNEIVFDAPNVVRIGKDLLCQISNSGNKLGFEWLNTILAPKGYRIHLAEKIYSYAHFDSTILPLRPGLVLFNADRVTPDNYPKIFESWDKIWFTGDKLSVPTANMAGGIAPCSPYIGLNFLSVNEKLVICDIEQEELRRELGRWGIETIGLPCRQARTMSGGFHCSTLDVKRTGTLQDYFN
jgi:N-dimethylarginine dimethylaminohydrolase